MLAGKMKLKTFLFLVISGVAFLGAAALLGLGGLTLLLPVSGHHTHVDEPDHSRPTTPAPVPMPVPVTAQTTDSHEQAALALQGRQVPGGKQKDVFPDRSYKINLYQDEGAASANRAKVDLDRDDQWDEKWTFDNDGISRQISPHDNEQYTETVQWNGTGWAGEEDAVPNAIPAAMGRPVDEVVLSYVGRDLGTAKLKDVTKGKPFKVNVYQDDGNTTANRAKVDLDRDDQWDEKWTFKPDGISRQTSPNDDEDYTKTTHWDGSTWVPE